MFKLNCLITRNTSREYLPSYFLFVGKKKRGNDKQKKEKGKDNLGIKSLLRREIRQDNESTRGRLNE